MNENLKDCQWYFGINKITSENTWIDNQWSDFKTTIRILLTKKNAVPEEQWHLEYLFKQ
jgi:hypothetical protein